MSSVDTYLSIGMRVRVSNVTFPTGLVFPNGTSSLGMVGDQKGYPVSNLRTSYGLLNRKAKWQLFSFSTHF